MISILIECPGQILLTPGRLLTIMINSYQPGRARHNLKIAHNYVSMSLHFLMR